MEACVLHGLKRRAAGFLRSNKIAALFMKVGKSFPPAEELCRKAQELEQIIETKCETHTSQLIFTHHSRLQSLHQSLFVVPAKTLKTNDYLSEGPFFNDEKLLNNSCL